MREKTGLTRAQLSVTTGVTASAIVRLETGYDVRLSTYLPILHYFVGLEPEVWLLAERVALLPAADRARVLALLGEHGGPDGGEHD